MFSFVVVVAIVVACIVLRDGSARGTPGAELSPPPPQPSRIMERSSLEKLELRVEKYSPSKQVNPAALEGSCACLRMFALVQRLWSLMARKKRSCWTFPLNDLLLTLHWSGGGGVSSCRIPFEVREMKTSSH